MTVVSSSNTITFAGDGVQTLFDFNFKIFKEEDLAAVVRDSCGIERELVAGSDFKLISETGNDSGGRAMYPVSGSPLQPGDSITFYREIAYSQELELVDNDPFSAGLLNEAFDRGVMRDQQLQEQVARALKYDISTPAQDQLMPQEFMRNIIDARDDSATARAGAESALSKSEAAQLAAEYAKLGAETAQAAAEYAKSEAEAIAWDGIEHLRSSTPVLSGPESANEGTTVEVSIVDYVEDSLANYEINVSGFGSANLVGSVIKWTLGSVDVDTVYSLKVVKRRRGEIYSETADYRLLVKNVLISDGPTMAFTNDYKGWPGAAIDTEVLQPPAFSVGAVNEKQIVSGKMEVDVTSGQKTVLDGTTATFLKVLEEIIAGDLLITDQGECVAGEISENRTPSTVVNKNYYGSGSGIVSGTHINTQDRLPNGGEIQSASGNFNNNATVSPAYCVFKKVGVNFELVFSHAFSNSNASISFSYKIPDDEEEYYFGVTAKTLSMYAGVPQAGGYAAGVNSTTLGQIITLSGTITPMSCAFSYKTPEVLNFCSCKITLPAAPTKVFKNPLQGETINVGVQSTTTSLKTSQPINEGESLFLDGVDGVAGTVVSTRFTGTWPVNSIVKTVTPGVCTGQDSVIKAEDGTLFAISRANLLMSVDNGVTWTIQNSSVSDSYLYSFAVCSKGYLYLAGYVRGLLRSKDKGKTWSDCRTAVCTGNPMAVGAKGNTIVMGEHSTNKVYTSYNNGDTWVMSKDTGGVHASSVYFASNGDIYEGGSGNFYVSKDNGITFNTVSHNLGSIGYVNWFNEYGGNLYLGGTGGCGKSSDGGVTWSREPLTGTYGHGSVIAGDILYAAGFVDKNYCILKYNLSTQKQYDSMLVADPSTSSYVGSFALVDNKILYAEDGGTVRCVTVDMDSYSTDITSFGLTTPPQYASRKKENIFALGTGRVGEYIGPKVDLELVGGTPVEYPYAPTAAQGNGNPVTVVSNVLVPSGTTITALAVRQNAAHQYISAFTNQRIGLVKKVGLNSYVAAKWFSGYDNTGSDSFEYMTLPTTYTVPADGSDYYLAYQTPTYYDYAQDAGDVGGAVSSQVPEGSNLGTLSFVGKVGVMGYKTVTESTTSKLVLTSAGSIAAKLFVEGGLHNNVLCDDAIDAKIASVSEEIVDGEPTNIVPLMTGSTTKGFSVSSPTDNPSSPTLAMWNAFDGKNDGSSVWYLGAFVNPLFGTITFDKEYIVVGYRMRPRDGNPVSSRSPKDWTVKNQSGTVIDTQTSQINWLDEWREFTFATPQVMSAFAFDITSVVSGASFEIGAIEILVKSSQIKTTVNLETTLAKVPTKVAIPDRYNLTPSGYASELSDGKLKITADKIELPDDANIKQLAMAVRSPEDMRFTDGKIYIQEKP